MKPNALSHVDALRHIGSLEQLLAAEREARQRAEYERDSLRMERDGLEHVRLKDNAYLLGERDKAISRAGQAEERHRQQVEWAQACENERLEVQTRAEQAERERDALKQERDEDQGVIRVWRGRCERAEATMSALQSQLDEERRTVAELRQERDASDKRALKMCAVQEAEMQARLRAEADNAALLSAVRAMGKHSCTKLGCMECFERARAEQRPHPGAALLEYVQALEKVREALKSQHLFVPRCTTDEQLHAQMEVGRACAAADALKVKP